MRILMLGPPGAGKGTQAVRVADRFGVPHIATGDILRRAVDAGTALGSQAREIMERGDLVPDQLVNEIIQERLAEPDTRGGWVLDGYPRTTDQATYLEEALSSAGQDVDRAVLFSISGDEIVRRLGGRRVCPACETVYHIESRPPTVTGVCDKDGSQLIHREDDHEATIRHRLEVYGRETKPLIDLYEGKGVLREIDGAGRTDEVFDRIIEAVSL